MLPACERLVSEARRSVREVSWDEVRSPGGAGDHYLIDVREPDEYRARSVPDAINVPRGLLEFAINRHPALQHLDEQALLATPLYLFCGTGGRSVLAAKSLESLGFEQVYSIRGGLGALP